MDLTSSILEGLYLMLVGMSFVLGFLTLVVISLKVLAYFAPSETVSESNQKNNNKVKNSRLLAVITAAVHQYQNDPKQKK